MSTKLNADWPVLRKYGPHHLAKIALPLGGIGTGTVSLGGRGDLRDWEVMNRPAKGFVPAPGHGKHSPCFVLWTRQGKKPGRARLLEGPLDLSLYEASHGSRSTNHGLPRFRKASFAAAYPFGQVMLTDPDVPVDARIDAFNPLVPVDADASGIPVAVLRFTLTNTTDSAISAAVAGVMPNFIGMDGSSTEVDWGGNKQPAGAKQNVNTFREGAGVRGIWMTSQGVPSWAEQGGTMALTTTSSEGLSHRTAWANRRWGDSVLDFWDDLLEDGAVDERERDGVDMPTSVLASRVKIPAGRQHTFTFLITWHFPNRITWTPRKVEEGEADDQPVDGNGECCDPSTGCCEPPANPNRVGNYYTTCWRDAWHVAEDVAARLDELESRTISFVNAVCNSDLPLTVREASLFNIANLRSQTCFRTEDGRFYGFEGCHDGGGCCMGSCTHVWNYELTVPMLFGSLSRSMREVEFAHATHENGLMSFRVNLPIARAKESKIAAADGQMGCIMKLYRDWRLSGDNDMLVALWPHARRAVEFCWIDGGWDADRDGVMEGWQPNTMDVEYYGPNPQMQGWYLGALRAAEEMARHIGQHEFADECRTLFDAGSAWMDEHLFNGDYYEHEIRPMAKDAHIAEGLQIRMGADDPSKPILQLGAGCLVDQLVGQYMAHVCGLGYLHDKKKVRKTLKAIMKHNFKEGFHDHFNHMRSFVLGDESALLMASYPRGNRPAEPFPYYNEVMTGFEYTAAVGMLQEGQAKAGLKAIEAIRDRYDGRKRSPFNEAECGHHYARAMASWAALLALTGFHYDAIAASMRFAQAERSSTWFWSTGNAWGTAQQKPGKNGKRPTQVKIDVIEGAVKLLTVAVEGVGAAELPDHRTLRAGDSVEVRI